MVFDLFFLLRDSENDLYNEAEVFSLSIRNPNGRPMLQFDWLIHSGLILARSRCLKILQSDQVWFSVLFYKYWFLEVESQLGKSFKVSG